MFNSYITLFRSEYEKSLLLKYTVPAILLLLVLYLMDALSKASNDRIIVQEEKIKGLQQQADWSKVSEESQLKAAELSSLLWEAETLELASADLQSELRTLTKDRVIALRINMASPEPLVVPNIWKLSAEVTGKLLASQVPEMLLDIAKSEPALSIDRFSYMPSRNQAGAIHISVLVSLGKVSRDELKNDLAGVPQ